MKFEEKVDMQELIYAKSSPPESLAEHTERCLAMLEQLKQHYESLLTPREWEVLLYAVKAHDLGKIDVHFQNKIRSELKLSLLHEVGQRFEHGYLSAAYLSKKFFLDLWDGENEWYRMLVLCIYYHHARKEADLAAMQAYIKDELSANSLLYPFEEPFLLQKPDFGYLKYIDITKLENEDLKLRYILIKGMLNRIDYTASAHLNAVENAWTQAIGPATEAFLQEKNYPLYPVQRFLFENRDQNVIVCASTGCGKTEGALLWCWDTKAFYTLPVKVSIKAIFGRIRHKIKYTAAAILHSGAKMFYLLEEDDLNKYEQARLFTWPLTICTIDQILRFIFKGNGTEIYASVLAGAKLVIDEIQAYSPDLIGNILYALSVITKLGGKFAIITATFPNCLYGLMKECGINAVRPDRIFHSPISRRHRIKLLTAFPFDQIIEQGAVRKVLVICNTIQSAQRIYEKLAERGAAVQLLHSMYLRRDRALLEEKILSFAPNNQNRTSEPGIWVSTQIVEASLDLDFDILYTEANTIDSLLQRMGRVYRNRSYDLGQEPNIYIIDCYHPIIDGEIYDYTIEALRAYDGALLEESDEEDTKTKLINLVYDETWNDRILQSQYYGKIKERIKFLQDLEMYTLDKDKISKKFRDIDSITVMPKSIYQILCENGKMSEWKRILSDSDKPYTERLQAKELLLNHTISITYYQGLPYEANTDRFLFEKCGVYLIDCPYDFNEDRCIGLGLLRPKKQTKEVDLFW